MVSIYFFKIYILILGLERNTFFYFCVEKKKGNSHNSIGNSIGGTLRVCLDESIEEGDSFI